jgi:8-oxo-dGTP diphosphatase
MTTEATLCYIIRYGKILLIRKKKGLGEGVWNGPGGKLEKGESLQDCAKRETYEEAHIVPEAPKKIGELNFYFGQTEEVDWHVHVFVADEFDGIEKETDEAAPKWFRIERIPYDEMWPDDQIWMPLMLEGKKFVGDFYFDRDARNLLSHDIREVAVID